MCSPISHKQALSYPFKRFDIAHCFRGERAQAGRFRGFVQADLDVISEKLGHLSEVECLNALVEGLKRLQIPPFVVYLNHIGIPRAIMEKMGVSSDMMPDALRIVDKMDKIGIEKVAQELTALIPTIDLTLLELLSFRGSLEEFSLKMPEDLAELPAFKEFEEFLTFLGKGPFSFAPGMVRGLDYYTGVVYETFLLDYPNFGSISSGGRYNKLVDSIIKQETKLEGFGISIGLTRLFEILKREDILPNYDTPTATVLVAYRDPSLQKLALEAASLLRNAGITVDLYSGTSAIGKQISYANKKEIPFVFMLMGESYVIKDLRNNTQSDDIFSIDSALQNLLDHLI